MHLFTVTDTLLLFAQVYTFQGGPETHVSDLQQVPQGAKVDFKRSTYAGMPLIKPHASDDECWEALERALALLLWHLMGAEESGTTYEATLHRLTRCMPTHCLKCSQLWLLGLSVRLQTCCYDGQWCSRKGSTSAQPCGSKSLLQEV